VALERIDMDGKWLTLCLVAGLVIGVNGFLFISLRRNNLKQQVDILRKASQNARQPWRKEDQALAELSRQVKELKKPDEKNE